MRQRQNEDQKANAIAQGRDDDGSNQHVSGRSDGGNGIILHIF